MEEKELQKVEKEIFEKIRNEIKNISYREQKRIIEKEVRQRSYMTEDWQIHYAIERIREMSEQEKEEMAVKKTKFWHYRNIGKKEAGKTALIALGCFALLYFLGVRDGLLPDILSLVFWIAGLIWLLGTMKSVIRDFRNR